VEEQRDFLVCHLLADGTITFVNEALCRCVGASKKELIGNPFWPFIAKQDLLKLRTYLAESSLHDPDGCIEHRLVTREGKVRCLVWSGRALFSEEGPSEFQAIGRDITEQKEAEEELRESERTLRALFDAITEPVMLLDVNRRVLALNRACAHGFNKRPQDMVGKFIDDYLEPEATVKRKQHTDCAGIYLKNNATGELELVLCEGIPDEVQKKVSPMGSNEQAMLERYNEKPAYLSLKDAPNVPYREILIQEGGPLRRPDPDPP
jgi:PAS domain S-box-containing protein